MSLASWPDWIDDTARLLGVTYGERIWNGDEDALDEAMELAVQARDIRLLPEAPDA